METFQKGAMVLTDLSRWSGAESSGRGGLWCCWMGKRTKNKIIAEKNHALCQFEAWFFVYIREGHREIGVWRGLER